MPVNSPLFEETSNAQWLWYFHNFLKDEEEGFKFKRDMVEYHAGFIEPESVKRVRRMREGDENKIKVTNEAFNSGLKNLFGRDLAGNANENTDNKATLEDYKYWEDKFGK